MSQSFIGQIMIFAGNFAPRNFAMCNGQLMSIAQNNALFALLGTTYGGDGQSTFALPNLQGRVPVHMGQGQGLSPYDIGQVAGEAAHTLTINEMAQHTHAPQFSANASANSPVNNLWAPDPNGNITFATSGTEQLAPDAIGPSGGKPTAREYGALSRAQFLYLFVWYIPQPKLMTSSRASVFTAPEQIAFRSELPEDDAFLYRLYASTRAHEMALTGWPVEAQEAFLKQQFQFQTIHYHRYYSDASFQIILLDDSPVGRIYIHYGTSDILLIDIALLPECRGVGIGGWILRNLLDEASRSQRRITLHVEPHNPALRLYQGLGFRVIDEPGMSDQFNLFMEYRPAL